MVGAKPSDGAADSPRTWCDQSCLCCSRAVHVRALRPSASGELGRALVHRRGRQKRINRRRSVAWFRLGADRRAVRDAAARGRPALCVADRRSCTRCGGAVRAGARHGCAASGLRHVRSRPAAEVRPMACPHQACLRIRVHCHGDLDALPRRARMVDVRTVGCVPDRPRPVSRRDIGFVEEILVQLSCRSGNFGTDRARMRRAASARLNSRRLSAALAADLEFTRDP